MDEHDSDRDSFRRRNFLRATGVAAVGVGAIEPASAGQGTEYGPVSFVEVGLFHRTTLPEVEGSFSFVDIDDPVEHEVDRTENVLYLNGTVDGSIKRVIEGSNHVSKIVGYHPIPSTVAPSPSRIITTDLGRAFRRTGGLLATRDYQAPVLDLSRRVDGGTEDVVVSAGDQRIEVAPEASGSTQLPSRTVQAPVEKPTGEKVQNDAIPKQKRAQQIETKEVPVTVTPVVEARNYGRLDVVENSL